jgi:hypothetical protein
VLLDTAVPSIFQAVAFFAGLSDFWAALPNDKTISSAKLPHDNDN